MLWFDEDVESFKDFNGYPIIDELDDLLYTSWGPGAGEPNPILGTPVTYPLYDDDAFFLFDLGVVLLDDPINMTEYGTLPTQDGQFDGLRKGRNGASKERSS